MAGRDEGWGARPVANPHRGEVAIELLGRVRVMRPTFRALAEIEQETGKGLHALARDFLESRFGIRDVASIVAAGLRGAGQAAGTDEVGELVFRTGFRRCCTPAARLLIGALGGEPEEADDGPGEAPAEGPATTCPSAGT